MTQRLLAPDAASPGVPEAPLTVGELARRIVVLLERGLGRVCVVGEVSNVRIPQSGHCYFVLKDDQAALNAVCFRGVLQRQPVSPVNGIKLEVVGQVTAYPPRSEYQIIVQQLREAGAGDLMRRFLALKEKLQAEGLFDSARKRPLPRLPRAIGIVTSPTGAALRDMLQILNRRARGLTIYLAPASVQGEAAPGEIVRALGWLTRHGRADVIIAGRGGGSLEDLWAFNDERVVRAIAACPIPVISAVGHETDVTLADFAADLRAPTPSAAAELVTAHYGEIEREVAQGRRRLVRAVAHRFRDARARLDRCRASWGLRSPIERLERSAQRIDDLRSMLEQTVVRWLERRRRDWTQWAERLTRAHPKRRAALWLARLDAARRMGEQLQRRLAAAAAAAIATQRARVGALTGRLASVNPEAILQRGYSIVVHARTRRVVTRPDQVRPHDVVRVRSAGGEWRAAALPPGPDLFDSSIT